MSYTSKDIKVGNALPEASTMGVVKETDEAYKAWVKRRGIDLPEHHFGNKRAKMNRFRYGKNAK